MLPVLHFGMLVHILCHCVFVLEVCGLHFEFTGSYNEKIPLGLQRDFWTFTVLVLKL